MKGLLPNLYGRKQLELWIAKCNDQSVHVTSNQIDLVSNQTN